MTQAWPLLQVIVFGPAWTVLGRRSSPFGCWRLELQRENKLIDLSFQNQRRVDNRRQFVDFRNTLHLTEPLAVSSEKFTGVLAFFWMSLHLSLAPFALRYSQENFMVCVCVSFLDGWCGRFPFQESFEGAFTSPTIQDSGSSLQPGHRIHPAG